MATLALTVGCRSCRLLSSPLLTRCILPTSSISCRPYSKKTQRDVKPPGKVKVKAVGSAVKYLDFMTKRFEDRFPAVYRVYKILKDGVAGFYADAKVYYRVMKEVYGGVNLSTMKRTDLENYNQFPRELTRVGATVVMLNIPIIDFLVVPLLYLFPRQLLSRHFWTPEQKLDFGLYYLKPRLEVYPDILDYMERHARDIKDQTEKDLFQTVLQKINKGKQPTVEEILHCKALFERKPFGLDHLSKYHRIEFAAVAKSMNLPTVSKQKLIQGAIMLHYIDLAIVREGVASMSLTDLQDTCFRRGLNVVDLSRKDLEDYLTKWLAISKETDESSISLLLHSPVLLGYTLPSNRKWMITKREN